MTMYLRLMTNKKNKIDSFISLLVQSHYSTLYRNFFFDVQTVLDFCFIILTGAIKTTTSVIFLKTEILKKVLLLIKSF